MARKRTTIAWHYAHGLRAAVRFNAQAFGFSIVVTSAFGIVAAFEGLRPWARPMRSCQARCWPSSPCSQSPPSASLALGSTASGLGAATLVAHFLGGLLAWGLAPFVASAVFLLFLGLEFAVVEEVED